MRRECEETIEREDPLLLVGSVMCRDFCQMMRINWPRMSPVEQELRMSQARSHLQFVCKRYKKRSLKGRYYLHEHPQQATSWEDRCIT